MKLELKHLSGYLPYELKGVESVNGVIHTLEELRFKKGFYYPIIWRSDQDTTKSRVDCKPVLRPLSDLTKEIEVNGEEFVPIRHIFYDYRKGLELCFNFRNGVLCEFWLDYKGEPHGNKTYIQESNVTFIEWQKLLEWHFDIYGLIEKGLAIDINKLHK